MKTVTLIEDDADLFSLLKYNLEKEGFRFTGSPTGKDALELCRRERPDVIILDIMLPDSDGIEICRGIRSSPDLAHVPVIFLTARGSESDRILGASWLPACATSCVLPRPRPACCAATGWSSTATVAVYACTARRSR